VGIARTLLIMPTAIAPAVAGLAFRHLYSTNGLIPALLEGVGIQVPSEGILGSPDTALIGVMATDIWQWTPFVALIVLAALQGIPQEVLEAAQMDGANGFRTLVSIVLPMMQTVIVTVTLLRFISTFNIFDIVFVETRGGPGVSTTVVGLDIFYNGLTYYNIGYASALTWIVAIFIAIVINIYLFANRPRKSASSGVGVASR
jgi:multiple sugar transport system permease protein